MTRICGPALVSRAHAGFISAGPQVVSEMLGRTHLKLSTRLVDPFSSGDDWDRMVSESSDGQFFHSAAWARVLIRTYGHRPFYLAATAANRTVALAPIMEVASPLTGKRGVCLPFSDFCSPLLFDQEILESVFDRLFDLGRSRAWKYLMFRGGPDNLISSVPGFYFHCLNLDRSESELFLACSSAVRRALRKAQGSPLRAEIATSAQALKEFYRLHCLTRRRHGLPPQPWKFFENIHKEVISAGKGFVIIARHDDLPVAGAVFFLWNKKALYKFGASDATVQHFRGNNLVIWEAIKFCRRQGMKSLHFGRTDPGHEGLRRFKLAWGTEETTSHYRCFDFRRDQWRVSNPPLPGFYQRVFRTMPLSFNRIAGTLLYPHLD